MVRGVPIDKETPKMTLLLSKICRLNLLNVLIVIGEGLCACIHKSVRACLRVGEYLHMYCVLKQK